MDRMYRGVSRNRSPALGRIPSNDGESELLWHSLLRPGPIQSRLCERVAREGKRPNR